MRIEELIERLQAIAAREPGIECCAIGSDELIAPISDPQITPDSSGDSLDRPRDPKEPARYVLLL